MPLKYLPAMLPPIRTPAPERPIDARPIDHGPVAAAALGGELDRLRTEEQARIDRQRQETLARLQELARFD